MTEFKDATEEFLPIAKELYEKHKVDLHLKVDPENVMFLRSDSRKKAFAYCKLVQGEYELLTDKKFFIVIINEYFNILKTDAQKRYVILHEMKHMFITDSEKYRLLDHNLKDFTELLKNPEWNLALVGGDENTNDSNDSEVKIDLNFDFHDKEAVEKLREKIKAKAKESEKKELKVNNDGQ